MSLPQTDQHQHAAESNEHAYGHNESEQMAQAESIEGGAGNAEEYLEAEDKTGPEEVAISPKPTPPKKSGHLSQYRSIKNLPESWCDAVFARVDGSFYQKP